MASKAFFGTQIQRLRKGFPRANYNDAKISGIWSVVRFVKDDDLLVITNEFLVNNHWAPLKKDFEGEIAKIRHSIATDIEKPPCNKCNTTGWLVKWHQTEDRSNSFACIYCRNGEKLSSMIERWDESLRDIWKTERNIDKELVAGMGKESLEVLAKMFASVRSRNT